MPLHLSFDDYTPAQIHAAGGVPAIHDQLLLRALSGPLAFLKDNRQYVVQVAPRNPQPVVQATGTHRVQVDIRWLVLRPDDANVNEFVPGSALSADDKGPNAPRFEATLPDGKRFEPHPEGWRRVL